MRGPQNQNQEIALHTTVKGKLYHLQTSTPIMAPVTIQSTRTEMKQEGTLINTGTMITMVSRIKTSMNDVSQTKCKNWHLECMPWKK